MSPRGEQLLWVQDLKQGRDDGRAALTTHRLIFLAHSRRAILGQLGGAMALGLAGSTSTAAGFAAGVAEGAMSALPIDVPWINELDAVISAQGDTSMDLCEGIALRKQRFLNIPHPTVRSVVPASLGRVDVKAGHATLRFTSRELAPMYRQLLDTYGVPYRREGDGFVVTYGSEIIPPF